MADLTGNDIVKLLLPAWRRAMDEGRHRDAVLTAILGYFVLRERKDDTYDKMPLYWMQKATFLILEEFHNAFKEANKGNCSFCRRTEPTCASQRVRARLFATPAWPPSERCSRLHDTRVCSLHTRSRLRRGLARPMFRVMFSAGA
jgi:hypothetical protein